MQLTNRLLFALVLVSTLVGTTVAQMLSEFPVSIKLQTVDGKDFDSKMLRTDNDLLIIDFWNRGCAPCIDALNKFRDNYDTLKAKTHATIIAVAVQKRDEATIKLIEKEKWPFKIFFDTDVPLYKALSRWYQPGTVEVAFPTMFVFDKTNKMLTRVVGMKQRFKQGEYPSNEEGAKYEEVLETDMDAYYSLFQQLKN